MNENQQQPLPPEVNENQPKQNRNFSEMGTFVVDLIKVLLIALVIILPVRYYVAQPFIVSGSSMEPTFYTGEYLIIDELTYHISAPQRGDVIVFKYPKDNTQYFIKRIIGLPGETVKIQENKVIIINAQNPQGFVLDEKYLPAGDTTFPYGQDTRTLGSTEYFVLGDNRLASSDSRFWGPVPTNDIVGKVFVRAFPFQTFKKFNHVEYSQ
ncbi:MAG: signal peptidase signal peptidase [Candidatus Doudnabacteria bacterium]|nr:signal peptidase signal peptidase [Candidatus Doudnabacteria bacterium]